MIDLDIFLSYMIEIKIELIKKRGKNIEDIFYAADVEFSFNKSLTAINSSNILNSLSFTEM